MVENKIMLSFKNVCENEFNNQYKPKKKKSIGSLLKTLAKITPEECRLLLTTHPTICTKNYLHKSALHWACDNKNVDVLKETLDFYVKNNLNIFVECRYDKIQDEKVNIAYYSLKKSNMLHFLLCSSYGIKIFNSEQKFNNELFYNSHSFSLHQILFSFEYYNSDAYKKFINNIPEHWCINPLNFSFWHQNKTLVNILLKNNFIEKQLWVEQLEEEISYMLSIDGSKEIIFDSMIFYLLDYLSLNNVLKIINSNLEKNKNANKELYLFVSNSLEIFFSNRYCNNTTSFNEIFMKQFCNEEMNEWKKFEKVLEENKLFQSSWPYLESIRKIELSYKLHSTLVDNTKKLNTISKI